MSCREFFVKKLTINRIVAVRHETFYEIIHEDVISLYVSYSHIIYMGGLESSSLAKVPA